jgi:hypothetical protein
MIIETVDCRCRLLKANVVETGKGGARDVFDGVVGHEKQLLEQIKLV